MLSASALDLVMAVARGTIKLAGRLDLLMAEKEGVQGPLVIPMPVVTLANVTRVQRIDLLSGYLESTKAAVPDPLGSERARLATVLEDKAPVAEIDRFFEQIFPDRAGLTNVDPDEKFVKALRLRAPGLDLDNPEIRLAAFYITAGEDARTIKYVARTALLVADVVAEFGAENAALFIRHQPTRDVVTTIVGRFAKPDLESFSDWSPLLRHALSTALEGLLDNKASIEGSVPWLDAVLSALAMAKEDPKGGEDFVTGLVNGKGYQLLFSKGLLIAADRLAPDDAQLYRQIAADVLQGAAPLVKANGSGFRGFFNDNWGELLRAGLTSIDKHGAVLLEGASPLLREVTLSLIGELARQPDLTALSREAVFKLADVAIGTAAKNPKLLTGSGAAAWFKAVVVSSVGAVSDQGVRQSLTRDGAQHVLLQALGVLGDQPELLVDKPGAAFELVGSVLKAVSVAGALDARTLGTATVTGVLERLADHPDLVGTRYAEMVSAFSGQLAQLVATKTFTAVQASDVIHAAADAALRNPDLFTRFEGNLASAVVTGVLKGAKASNTRLVAGATLVRLLDEVLQTVARRGQSLLEKAPTEAALVAKLMDTVSAGLERAEAELGRSADGASLPLVLSGLVAAVAQGELIELNPKAAKFIKVFARLSESVAS